MADLITSYLKPDVFCYLDDIIVEAKNLEEHLKHLKIVLEKMNKAKLTISL